MNNKIINLILYFLTAFGFGVQTFEKLPNLLKIILLVFSIICFIVLVFLLFYDKTKMSRKKLIEKGKNMLKCTSNKVILLSGDMSWEEDYFKDLKELKNASKEVVVIFPKSKLDLGTKEAQKDLKERIDRFEGIRIKVLVSDEDFEMRGFIVDPKNQIGDSTKMLFAKKLKVNKNPSKSIFKITELNSKDNNENCRIILYYFEMIEKTSIKFKDMELSR